MKITIDNQKIKVKEGKTILEAAEESGIYIPHICSHPELTNYGGCRLCIVEVEGLRGYPTACTTIVKEGMKVLTQSKILDEMRREIIQLILSDHPAGCLICGEKEECADFQTTIRKVGATTGCRWCTKDRDCELQRVVQHLGIDEIIFPVYYQGFPVEKYDPFFDRDYNLCIYCGRCVRICNEHRKSSIITLRQRGKTTTVGPAYDLSHISADCEFCGACLSVCPTGTLSEKNRKWWGMPDAYHPSICPLCSLNCDIQVLIKGDTIIGTLPPGDPHQSGGELCVKGRFTLSELVNHPDRLKVPQFRFTEGLGEVSWEEATDKVTAAIKNLKEDRTAVYLSPFLTLEEMAAAKSFSLNILKTKYITSSVMNPVLFNYALFARQSLPVDQIEETADCIVSFFVNGNYNFGPLTLAIKRAADRGIPYFQVGWIRDTTSRFATKEFSPPAGQEKSFFRKIWQALEKGSGGTGEIKELVSLFRDSLSPVIVVGPEILDLSDGEEILKSLDRICRITDASVVAPDPFGNLMGLLSMEEIMFSREIQKIIDKGKIELLYIIGDVPFQERPNVKQIIHQSDFPPPEKLSADFIFPAATWGEISGTYVDLKGQKKRISALSRPPGLAQSHQDIFTKITLNLGRKEIKFSLKEIQKLIPQRLEIVNPGPTGKSVLVGRVEPPNSSYPYMIIQETHLNRFHNIRLNHISRGMDMILPEDTVILNPMDASKLGLHEEDQIFVESRNTSRTYPVLQRKMIPTGYIFLLPSDQSGGFETNPCAVHLRRKHV